MDEPKKAIAHPYVVVAAVDFAPGGDGAFREASQIATRIPGSELHVVHVVDAHGLGSVRGGHLGDLAEELTRARDRLTEYVTARADADPRLAGQTVGMHVRVGQVARALLQLTADVEADLLVVGDNGRSTLRKFLATSLSQRLLKLARCPVLVALPRDYRSVEHVPSIEPPCAQCLETRRATGGAKWWCARHTEKHPHAHTYSYSRQIPFALHDSEVKPTGVDL